MIVLSMVLVVVGFVLLMLGVLGVGDNPLDFVYYSIGACLLAAVFLIIGVIRGRPSKKPVAASGGEGKDASWSGASAWNDDAGDQGAATAVLERDQAPEGEEKPRVQVVAAKDVADDKGGDADEGWAPDEGADVQETAEDDVVVVPKASAAGRAGDSGAEVAAAADVRDDEGAAAAPAKKASAKKASAKKSTARKASAKKASAKKSTAKKATAKKASAKKSTAKKSTAKKSTAKKASAKRAPAKKSSASSRVGELQKFDDALSNVSGVGPAKRKVLADHFGSYAKLRSASVADIAEIDGISETVATRIRNTLNARGD